MKNLTKRTISLFLATLAVLMLLCVPALAADAAPAADQTETEQPVNAEAAVKSSKAWSAGIAIAVAAAAGALGMALVISKSVSGISRQPEAAEPIRSGMMLGLVFIETAIIYALIVAILIVFVL